MKSSGRTAPWDFLLDGRFDSKQPRRTLWLFFADQRWRALGAVALYVVKQAPASLMPLAVGMIVDALTVGREDSLRRVLWIAGGYLLLLAQNPFVHTWFVRVMSQLLRQMQFNLRSALVERLQQLSIGFYEEKQTGALQTKILRDVDAVDGLCRHLMHTGLNGLLVIVYVSVIALCKQPLLALYFLLTVPAGIALLKLFDRRFREQYQALRIETEQMSARISEMLQMLPVTRAHGLEDEEARDVRSIFHRLRKRGLKVDTLTEFFAASSWFTFNLFQLACLVFSAWLVIQKKITVGDAVMYHTYFGMLIGAVQQLLSVFPALAQGADAIRSIGEVLEAPEIEQQENKPPAPQPIKGEIAFDGVSYSYPKGREVALRNVSLRIAAGETVAFVGESGAGKSTFISLAIGLRQPSAGRVLLDGIDLREMNLRSYRRQIGVVPQTTILFNGTLRENVAFGLERISDEELWQVLADANLAEFVRKLPLGLETPLGESGTRLSGGQKQRLAIARALARDPRVILLDEATSALDAESERLVQEALVRLTKDRTTLIVAHRFSTIRHADRIVVMNRGEIADVGTQAELLARSEIFQRLARLQSLSALDAG
ncbi:MAG TPA: ABC transporter ATP-binding protein [Candidatus Paceibacterota bacterium]|nr:ABC transporter ATP-binding protein [Candidatus Paceibacterota bacterium]